MNLKVPRFVAFLLLLGLLSSQLASATNMPMTMRMGIGTQTAEQTCDGAAHSNGMHHSDSAMSDCCDNQHEACSSGCNCCLSLVAILVSPDFRSIEITAVFPEPIEPQNHSVPPVQALYRPPISVS
jgi:hypothetical protein